MSVFKRQINEQSLLKWNRRWKFCMIIRTIKLYSPTQKRSKILDLEKIFSHSFIFFLLFKMYLKLSKNFSEITLNISFINYIFILNISVFLQKWKKMWLMASFLTLISLKWAWGSISWVWHVYQNYVDGGWIYNIHRKKGNKVDQEPLYRHIGIVEILFFASSN